MSIVWTFFLCCCINPHAQSRFPTTPAASSTVLHIYWTLLFVFLPHETGNFINILQLHWTSRQSWTNNSESDTVLWCIFVKMRNERRVIGFLRSFLDVSAASPLIANPASSIKAKNYRGLCNHPSITLQLKCLCRKKKNSSGPKWWGFLFLQPTPSSALHLDLPHCTLLIGYSFWVFSGEATT